MLLALAEEVEVDDVVVVPMPPPGMVVGVGAVGSTDAIGFVVAGVVVIGAVVADVIVV